MSLGMGFDIYLEIGKVRTFAVVPAWPGWCRSGRDESSALQTLMDYGPRYSHALKNTGIDFQPPAAISSLKILGRMPGNTTTDFGAPAMTLPGDDLPVAAGELQRWVTILNACWQSFDQAVVSADGKVLSTGPRGGGRTLEKIIAHIPDAEIAFISALGGKWKPDNSLSADAEKVRLRHSILETLASSVRGEIPAQGPRGGRRWTPRFFVRRVAWHALDHAWEIEDRMN